MVIEETHTAVFAVLAFNTTTYHHAAHATTVEYLKTLDRDLHLPESPHRPHHLPWNKAVLRIRINLEVLRCRTLLRKGQSKSRPAALMAAKLSRQEELEVEMEAAPLQLPKEAARHLPRKT